MTCDKEFADKLKNGGGWLPELPDHDAPDNPQATRIVRYENMAGKEAYGVTFTHDDPYKYLNESPYIKNPTLYWESANN